jgi:hypothetical protein
MVRVSTLCPRLMSEVAVCGIINHPCGDRVHACPAVCDTINVVAEFMPKVEREAGGEGAGGGVRVRESATCVRACVLSVTIERMCVCVSESEREMRPCLSCITLSPPPV